MHINELYRIYRLHGSVTTDTRKIKKGDIFFALKGPLYNGNSYTKQAFDAGASYCVVDEDIDLRHDKIIRVTDSLQALQQLAKKHREQLRIPFIAITGSNGKTTTKELIHAVLSSHYKTYTTEGNLNNHIGVPLTILKIKDDAEIAIVEMGANHLKEIKSYCTYTEPTHGLITNCGKAHIEGFGSEENVRIGKGELFEYLKKNKGTAFVWKDDPKLLKMSIDIPNVITYGSTEADHTGKTLHDSVFLQVAMNDGLNIQTQLVGGYNTPNVLAAVCIGRTFGISDDNIRIALENYQPSNSRSQLIKKGNNSIILDAYNANPSSMKAAIENFAAMPGDNKILVLGGMKELGKNSIEDHTAIVNLINRFTWKKVILVGDHYINLPTSMMHFQSSDEAKEWMMAQQFDNVQMLIKGSRGMQMEKVLD